MISLHQQTWVSRGRVEGPSFCPSRAIQMLPIMQSDTVPSEDCSRASKHTILWCDSWLHFPLSYVQLSLPPDPWVNQTMFHACRAHRQNLMVDKSELHSTVLQTSADPWVYQTVFHACRAHRQNLHMRRKESQSLPDVTSLYLVVSQPFLAFIHACNEI